MGSMTGFEAEWPVPNRIRTWITQCSSEQHHTPYGGGNLATHVGDDALSVAHNRQQLAQQLGLVAEPQWLNQVHGTTVVRLPTVDSIPPEADGSYTTEAGVVCAVLTADCLPILLTNRSGSQVAALHAGWRGLAGGVVEQGIERFEESPEQLLAWIGPAIGQHSYEVGDEVREVFCGMDERAAEHFTPSERGRWYASMEGLLRKRLGQAGVGSIHGGGWDTYRDPRFFSYRRSGITGRFATLIWIQPEETI